MQPIVPLLVFCSIAPILLCFLEAARVSMGFSPIPVWLAKDFLRVSVAFSTLPASLLGFWVALESHKKNFALRIPLGETRLYQDFLKEENFNLCLLEEKTDEELHKIINVAHTLGELDKADVVSSVLVKRHL